MPKYRNTGSLRACPEDVNGKKQTGYCIKTKCQNVVFSTIYSFYILIVFEVPHFPFTFGPLKKSPCIIPTQR